MRKGRVWTEEEKTKVRKSSMRHFQLNDRKWLNEQYTVLGKTTVQIAKEVGCVVSTVFFALRRCKISARSRSQARQGIRFSQGHLENMKEANKVIGLSHRGKNHWNWKGGMKEYCADRHSSEWKDWRKKVYERDNYTCRGCGIKGRKKRTFDPHHILPVRDFPHLKYNIDNGITLCKDCHKKTFGKEYRYIAIFRPISKSGELLGSLDQVISSQAKAGMPLKVQRLGAESRTDSNAPTSPAHESDDIVCSLQGCKEYLG